MREVEERKGEERGERKEMREGGVIQKKGEKRDEHIGLI